MRSILFLILLYIGIFTINAYSQTYNLNQYDNLYFGMLEVKCNNKILLYENYDYYIDYQNKILYVTNEYYSDCKLDITAKPNGIYKYEEPKDYNLKSMAAWSLASIPKHQEDIFPESKYPNELINNYNRAKFCWYIIDPLFLRNNSTTPDHIRNNPDEQCYHFVREIFEREIYPDKEYEINVPTNMAVLNIAYYPKEKGQNNYCFRNEYNLASELVSAGIDNLGNLLQPSTRWGGIMRRIETDDLDYYKIGKLEFILMDPFADDEKFNIIRNDTNPYLYINFGQISEDILFDGKQSFEHHLLCSGNDITSAFGIIGNDTIPYIAFSNQSYYRTCQDIGYNGLNSEDEVDFFNVYLDSLKFCFGHNSVTYQKAIEDPSNDDYHYFRGTDYDNLQLSIPDRYKRYNLSEGNSPTSNMSSENYPTSATSLPNTEDINRNGVFDTTEAYYQYKISLKPEDFEIGKNHIIDTIISEFTYPDGTESQVTFYKFQIDLHDYESKHGEINSLSDVTGLRMFLNGLNENTFLRFVVFNLSSGNEISYFGNINYDDIFIFPNPSQGYINISCDKSIKNIQIYSVTGQKLIDKLIGDYYYQPNDNLYSVTFRQNLTAGIYFMKIYFYDNKEFVIKKIVIQ